MDDGSSWAGLVEVVFVLALALGFGIHQMLDLRRERQRRAAEREKR